MAKKRSNAGQADSGPGQDFPPGVKLLRTLAGHRRTVNRVAFDPQGARLASGSGDNTVKLWEADSGNLIRTLEGHNSTVYSVAFDPPGARLASGSYDNTVKLWEADSGNLIRTLEGHKGPVCSVAFDPPGARLASGSDDNTVKLWEADSGNLIRTLEGHKGAVASVAFDPQGARLASGSDHNSVNLWEADSGNLIRTLEGHKGTVYSVAFDPQGVRLASGSYDKTVKLWEADSGNLIRTLEGHTGPIDAVSFSPDGRLLASKSDDGTIRVWDCTNWATVAVIPGRKYGSWIPALAFHLTLPRLATAGAKPDASDGDWHNLIQIYELDLDVLLGEKKRSVSPGVELPHPDEHYRNAKVVLMGNTSVGKSGLGLVLAGRQFRATESSHGRHIWTMDQGKVTISLREMSPPADGKQRGTRPRRKKKSASSKAPLAEREGYFETRETLLWDLAGQPGYRLVHQLHLSEVAVALVLFDARSETEPFAGVSYWARALDAACKGFPMQKFLVSSRIDRGGTTVSRDRIDAIVKRYDFDGYFETSAKRGDGVEELQAALCEAIQWTDLPAVTRTIEFQETKSFLLERKRRGTVLATTDELVAGLKRRRNKRAEISAAVLETCLTQLEATGLIRRLPFGDWVLLQPELLDDYSGWLTLAARDEPDGLGHIAEPAARAGDFKMDSDRPLADKPDEEATLVLASVEELLGRGLAIREYDEEHRRDVLVFPTELRSDLPDYPGDYSLVMLFRFNGPVQGIYASLVVKLIYSIPFRKHAMHKNAAIFRDTGGRACGFAVDFPDHDDDSFGRLTVFFDDATHGNSRKLFLRYIHKQLADMAFPDSVEPERIYHCAACDYTIDPDLVQKARDRQLSVVGCGLCNRKYPLDDLLEQAKQPGEELDAIDRQAAAGQQRQSRLTIIDERRKRGEFHVFLCHSWKDKPAVRELAQDLASDGVLAWIDEEQLLPGDVVLEQLEQAIRQAGAIAVCIGPHGLGRWQTVEHHAAYERFLAASEPESAGGFRASSRLRVIPVLLPGAKKTQIPAFLRRHLYADLRARQADKRREEFQKLVAAVLGEAGKRR